MYKPTIYFAGKIKSYGGDMSMGWDYYNDWRADIMGWAERLDLHKSEAIFDRDMWHYNYWWPNYYREHGYLYANYIDHNQTANHNRLLIENADIVFVYLNTNDSFWTLAEIWYANALYKKIFIAYTDDVDEKEMRFVFSFADWVEKVKNHKEWWSRFEADFLPWMIMDIEDEIWYNELRDMEYSEFLKTDYRKELSRHAKELSWWRCQICNSDKKLETHHRCYDNRGVEWKELADLIVLCEKCHRKYHDKF